MSSAAIHVEQLFRLVDAGHWILACPRCGCEYVHIRSAYALEGSDPFEGASEHGEMFNIPVGGITEKRRGAFVINVWAECGHSFEIELSNERGETTIHARTADVQ